MDASTETDATNPYAPTGKTVRLFFPNLGEALDAFAKLNEIQKDYGYFTYNEVLAIFGLSKQSGWAHENMVWTEPLNLRNLGPNFRLKLSRPVPRPRVNTGR